MYKVVLVDDEAIIRAGIAKMLPVEELPLQLTGVFSNAFDVLEYLQDEMPDILITDIKMPQMNGLEMLHKALAMFPSIQVIILSGFDEFEFARSAMKLGVKEYLLKPCAKEDLTLALRNVCAEIDQQRKNVVRSMDQRRVLIDQLTDTLITLGRNAQNDKQIRSGVQELLDSAANREVIQEAVVQLVAVVENRIPSAQWQVEIIQSLYNRGDTDVVKSVSDILKQIYPKTKGRKGFVEEMCRYTQKQYMDPDLSLQFIADHVVHMNADYIGKEFTDDVGMKFSKYLLQIRISHAKKLIAMDPHRPIYEVAMQVGYGENQQYFTQMFKKVTNQTPKEFRDKVIHEMHGDRSECTEK